MVTYWYTILPSDQIINLCGPEHDPIGWTPEIIEERRKKTEHRVKVTNNQHKFFNKLEESILEEGIKNPIIVIRGFLTENYCNIDSNINRDHFINRIHPDHHDKLDTLLTCPRNGGSRLYLAQKHKLNVPCIVNDFTGGFSEGTQLFTKNDILKFYNDVPASMILRDSGLFVTGLPHIHIIKRKPYVTCFAMVPALEIDNTIQPGPERIKELEEENGFFTKLEKSILKDGMRNPVVLTAFRNTLTPRYGGSRIMIAQKHKLTIPAIIADFDNKFPDAEILTDANKIIAKFKDKPRRVHYKPNGLNIWGCPNIHLDE